MDYIREAAEYIVNLDNLRRAKQNLYDEVRELEAWFNGNVKETNLSGMPSGGRTLADEPVVNKMIRLEQAKKEYRDTSRTINRVERVINNLPENYKKLLIGWYIEGYREEQLMKDLHCSERTLFRIKREALRKLAIQIYGVKVIS